jgi:hypothetical protein
MPKAIRLIRNACVWRCSMQDEQVSIMLLHAFARRRFEAAHA